MQTLKQFIEFSPDAIVCVAQDGTIVLLNDQVGRLFGYSQDELIGEPLERLVPERFRGAHRERRTSYFGDPRTRPMGAGLELAGLRRDGSEFPAEISLSSVETEDGPLGVAAVRDVTERRRTQRTFEQFVEFAPDATVGVDADGVIVLVNQQAERLFGYARSELLGEPIETLVPERFHHHHGGHRSGYFHDPRTRPMGAGLQLAARRRDGSEFPAEISLSGIETEDGLLATAAVRDITDRVAAERERSRLEAQLSQSQRLESIGQLAGGVAHDFNNLLGVILNYADFIAQTLGPDSELGDDVAEVRRAAERGSELVRQLLTFSRREVISPEVLDVNTALQDVDRLLRRALGEHIDLRLQCAPGPVLIEADRGQLEQVLVNLAINARDAMPDGGTLTIATAVVDGSVLVTVRDTGLGMAPEVMDRVFEPFFTTKPKGEGSGLGLATVYGIVTRAGGEVLVRSEPGAGSTFEIRLPASAAPAVAPTVAPGGAEPQGSGTVLVVEDEPAVRRMTERILRAAGYEVLTEERAVDGLRVALEREEAIDLVLSDVLMPGMLGTELAERLGDIRPDLPVLLMSGYSDQRVDALTATDRAFVAKPFDAPTLLRKVRDVLGAA